MKNKPSLSRTVEVDERHPEQLLVTIRVPVDRLHVALNCYGWHYTEQMREMWFDAWEQMRKLTKPKRKRR